MPSFSFVLLLIFLISSNARAVFGCNGGSLNVPNSYTCCAQASSAGWNYRITTSSNDHFTARVFETSTSSTYYTSTECQVRSSGNSCTGNACVFSSSNTCDADTNGVVSSITPSMMCLKITCDNTFLSCNFDTVSATFYTSTPSPPPPAVVPSPPPPAAMCPTSSSGCSTMCSAQGHGGYSWSSSSSSCTCFNGASFVAPTCTSPTPSPPPPAVVPSPPPPAVVPSPPPATASTTGDCECQCCSTNYCTPIAVGSFNAGSSAACTANACRTQFSSSCPAATSQGSVRSEYTASTSTTTTTLSGTATSDTQNHRIQALCLSALAVCVTLLV